jgi:hypothetical protein
VFCIETNIDEILSLPDLSGVPTAFLTEIQQDQVYETIFQELQKKLPRRNAPASPSTLFIVGEQEQQKSVSPHLATEDDDNDIDDDTSVNDELSSSVSSENNASPSQDGYDTDIESGKFIFSMNDFT